MERDRNGGRGGGRVQGLEGLEGRRLAGGVEAEEDEGHRWGEGGGVQARDECEHWVGLLQGEFEANGF